MQFLDKYTIKLDRVLNDLDIYVLGFVHLLERHTPYVLVSGYISILFGRARATEDIDLFIPPLSKEAFAALYEELKLQGYWCLNAEAVDEVYFYLTDGLSVRFARQNETIPNFEVKFTFKERDKEALRDVLTVITSGGELRISSLERQIAFKRYFLMSEKDLEDAAHLEEVFKKNLDLRKIEECKKRIHRETASTGTHTTRR